MRSLSLFLSFFVMAGCLVVAQEVENVQVLPFKEKKEIAKFMKGTVAKSLGVKCNHCHDLKDYASDKNPHKLLAREMMRMMLDINVQLVSIQKVAQDVGMTHWKEAPRIDCWACHRGAVKAEVSVPE